MVQIILMRMIHLMLVSNKLLSNYFFQDTSPYVDTVWLQRLFNHNFLSADEGLSILTTHDCQYIKPAFMNFYGDVSTARHDHCAKFAPFQLYGRLNVNRVSRLQNCSTKYHFGVCKKAHLFILFFRFEFTRTLRNRSFGQ